MGELRHHVFGGWGVGWAVQPPPESWCRLESWGGGAWGGGWVSTRLSKTASGSSGRLSRPAPMPLWRQQTSIQVAQWDVVHNEFMLGVGGCLCLSMQFLIFVKINSKSLAPWGVWPPWQSYVSGASGPSSFEPPPPPIICPQSLVTVPKLPSGLSLCLVAPSLAEPTLGRRCCAWAGALFQARVWPTLCWRLQRGFPHQSQS